MYWLFCIKTYNYVNYLIKNIQTMNEIFNNSSKEHTPLLQQIRSISWFAAKILVVLTLFSWSEILTSCGNNKKESTERVSDNGLKVTLKPNSDKIDISHPITIDYDYDEIRINNTTIATITWNNHIFDIQIFICPSSIDGTIEKSEKINIDNPTQYWDGITRWSKLILVKNEQWQPDHIKIINKNGDDFRNISLEKWFNESIRLEVNTFEDSYCDKNDQRVYENLHATRIKIGELWEYEESITQSDIFPNYYSNDTQQQDETWILSTSEKSTNIWTSKIIKEIKTMLRCGIITPEQYKQRLSNVQLAVLWKNWEESNIATQVDEITRISNTDYSYLKEQSKNNPNTIFFITNKSWNLDKKWLTDLIECSKLKNVVLILTLKDIEQISNLDKKQLNNLNRNHVLITIPDSLFNETYEEYDDLPEWLMEGRFWTLLLSWNSSEELAKLIALSTILTEINLNNPLEKIINTSDIYKAKTNWKITDTNIKTLNLDKYTANCYKEAIDLKIPSHINPWESIILNKPSKIDEKSYFSWPGIRIKYEDEWLPYNKNEDLINSENFNSIEYRLDYDLCENASHWSSNIPVYYMIIDSEGKEISIKYDVFVNKTNQ